MDQVNYAVQKAWNALHFEMCILKKGNRNKKVEPTHHWYVLFLNMGLHAGIHAEKDI